MLALEYITPILCWRLRSLTIFSISSAGPKPLSTILAPCPASAVAIPSPIPLVEPVTIAVLPARMPFPLKMSSLKPPKFSATQGVECERTPTLL